MVTINEVCFVCVCQDCDITRFSEENKHYTLKRAFHVCIAHVKCHRVLFALMLI